MKEKQKSLESLFRAMIQFFGGVIVEIPMFDGHVCFIDACREHIVPHGYLYPGMTDPSCFIHLLDQMLRGAGKCVIEVVRPDGEVFRIYWGISKFGDLLWKIPDTPPNDTRKERAAGLKEELLKIIGDKREKLGKSISDISHEGNLDRTFVTRVYSGEFPRERRGRKYASNDPRYTALAKVLKLHVTEFVSLVEGYQKTISPD